MPNDSASTSAFPVPDEAASGRCGSCGGCVLGWRRAPTDVISAVESGQQIAADAAPIAVLVFGVPLLALSVLLAFSAAAPLYVQAGAIVGGGAILAVVLRLRGAVVSFSTSGQNR